MKKGDFLWVAALGLFISAMLSPAVQSELVRYPYMAGFAKFFVLATMGEMLSIRLMTKAWKMPSGAVYRALVWGIFGMGITLFFSIFQNGIDGAMSGGLLPFKGSRLAFAFFTSVAANVTFGPAMMALHRMTDIYINMKCEKYDGKITVGTIVNKIDWNGFISFVVFKTIPVFWIPAHTLTFSLPPEYRVLAAAMLSIALGAILAFAENE